MSWIDVPLFLEDRDSNAQAITWKKVRILLFGGPFCDHDSQRLVNVCRKNSSLVPAFSCMLMISLPRRQLMTLARVRE